MYMYTHEDSEPHKNRRSLREIVRESAGDHN